MSDGSVLLAHAKDEELAELHDLKAKRDEARAESARLIEKARALEYRASDFAQIAERDRIARRAALVAEALGEGEPPPPAAPPEPGPSPAELREAADVLKRRAAERTKEADAAHGSLRGRTLSLLEACAQRLGAEYLSAAYDLAAAHAGIAAADTILSAAGVAAHLINPEWFGLVVPNSAGLTALRGVGVVRGADFLRLPTVGGDDSRLRMASNDAASEAREAVRDLLGEWPPESR